MSLQLDPKRPIYLQIMEEIKKRAVRGEYTSGHKLPSVREMAKSVGVNPNTIARVYMELEREGFIFTRRGQGSFITEEYGRLEEERRKLADAATEQFIRVIGELELHNGHRQKLIDMIKRELTE
ncbi:GntR family transcriptional regulator [Candidatus Latescibacterota bacterium]